LAALPQRAPSEHLMTLPIPLTVRVQTARADRHIKADLHDLSFRSVVPGGFASARMTISRPLALQPDDVAYYGKVEIQDERNAQTVWAGRLEDPGRSVGSSGELWELAAVGPSAHAQDRTVPLIYVDRNLTRWYRTQVGGTSLVKDATDTTTEYELDDVLDAMTLTFPNGTPLPTNGLMRMQYRAIREAGQRIARFDYRHVEGWISTSAKVRAYMYPTVSLERDDNFSTTETNLSARVMTTNFAVTKDVVELRIMWTGAPTTAGDGVWSSIGSPYVMAQRFDKTGAVVGASGYTSYQVKASEIVADLLGRLLTQYDGANATVETTTFGIEQAAYPDGIAPAGVLADMIEIEPTFYWAAWEQNPNNGKHRFEWRTWPTTVAYDATVDDGYTSSGSAEGLYNEVMVRWRNARGELKQARRTQTVAALTDAGLTRDGFRDLGDEIASSVTAIQVGDQFLIEHKTAPNAGRLTVARPIYDHTLGRSVMPWEIRPGKLIRVRGILASSDALNATSRDGVTVFKVIAVDFDASSASATLELDSQPPSMAHMLAARMEMAQTSQTKRRRR
jgi:hypothetical protein